MNKSYLSIGIIARDKFSTVPSTLESLYENLPSNIITEILIFDSGYPTSIIDKIKNIKERNRIVKLKIINIAKFSNTNYVWNKFVSITNSNYLMCIENDVFITPHCIEYCINAITRKFCEVAVPVVFEGTLGKPHFDPVVSEITGSKRKGFYSKLVRRPKNGLYSPKTDRKVAHLERHCFLMSKESAHKLGKLDELMYCRTDIDMSFACYHANLIIGILDKASVIFYRQPDLRFDREFFDYRWNLDRVAYANNRLIKKWLLIDYKTTINHAYKIRKFLDVESNE